MDARGFRIALVADELVNPAPGGLDGLAVLAEEGWGAMVLPPRTLDDCLVAPLLEQIAQQVAEFARNGYEFVVIGRRDGLEEVLSRAGLVPTPATLHPESADEIRRFLRSQPEPLGSA